MKNKSIIRWAGSKKQLIPKILEHLPNNFERYIEPFVGSACLFFQIEPPSAILGDINPELINTYEQIRENPEKLHQELLKIPRNKDEYYKIRSTDPSSLSKFDKSVRFLYLNRNCFNGIYRLNKQGKFNVPWGTKTGEVPSLTEFKRCSLALKHAELKIVDFDELLQCVGPGDFVYLDPPYAKSVAGEPGLFGKGSFCFKDIERLANTVNRIDQAGASYLLSFEENIELKELLSHTKQIVVSARRSIAGFHGARNTVSELIFTNAG